MQHQVELDHIGFAVVDAASTLAVMQNAFGITPFSGEELPDFRYVLSYLGNDRAGMRVELLDPNGTDHGFVQSYLAKTGEGPHHLTFMVSDLEAALDMLSARGVEVIKVDLRYPPWREAFIRPSSGLGIVVQLAQSTLNYPSVDEVLHGDVGDPMMMPHIKAGTNRQWWKDPHPRVSPDDRAVLTRISLNVHDLALAKTLFGEVLAGETDAANNGDRGPVLFRWGDSELRVEQAHPVGVHTLDVIGSSRGERFAIGSTDFVRSEQ
ncbi:VOC family protein [Rhodococcus fascians]|nr:VOC family protein [Rhodococcus fascians]MBY4238364.1 VOC family protein [Rhodococcus fascians]MBY4254255.1 VOC family protein [Rhodococcus fascians]MBY4269636.1 VOC family protein [Rhodococcus fascians]